MSTTIAETPTDLTSIRRLSDPREKLRVAALVIEKAEQEMEPRRLRRNAAAVILFRLGQSATPPMQPAAMWRDTIVVSRSLWHKIMDEASAGRVGELREELDRLVGELAELPTERAAELPQLIRERDKVARRIVRHADQVKAIDELQAEIDADPEVGHRLLAIAREEAKEVRRLEVLIEEAMKLRDEVAVKLLTGHYSKLYGRVIPNAEIARLAKLSTARIAQFRDIRFTG